MKLGAVESSYVTVADDAGCNSTPGSVSIEL